MSPKTQSTKQSSNKHPDNPDPKVLFPGIEERNKAVSLKAYEIYQSRNGEKRVQRQKYQNYYKHNEALLFGKDAYVEIDDEKEDWFEAEKAVDRVVFSQSLTSNELYQALMVRFYSTIDIETASSEDLAKKYLDYVNIYRGDLDRVAKEAGNQNEFDFRNVALLLEQTEISFLTKRILMLADTSLLSHNSDVFHEYYTEPENGDSPSNEWADVVYETNCPDLNKLGKWLKDAHLLLNSGEVFYYPQTRSTLVNWNMFSPRTEPQPMHREHIFEAIIKSRRLVQPIAATVARSNIFRSIVQVDLPYLDTVALQDFSKITLDEHQHLEKFRDHLKENLIDLATINGTEAFDAGLTKIGMQIKAGTNSLARDIKRLERKNALQVAGTSIGTLVATLIAINSNLTDVLATLIGAGGGFTALLKQLSDYEEQYASIEDSPYYYLWLLDTK